MSSDVQLVKFDPEQGSSVATELMSVTKEQIYSGNLILVNGKYPVLNSGIATDLVSISQYSLTQIGYTASSGDLILSQQVLERFQEMVAAAQLEEEYHFILTSGYRSKERQAELYIEKGADYALPAGFSEHNVGLSIDIGSSTQKMEYASEGKWLQKYAWDYGFILRYPTDKTAITGIQYEPWHFRYVGLPHSIIMKEKDWVLEQYISYLQQNHSIKANVGERRYEIRYYPYKDNMMIEVPVDVPYEVSGDNIGGIIVTIDLT